MLAKKVYQYSKDGLFLQEFESLNAAKKFAREKLNAKDGSSIQGNLSGKMNFAYGFIWSYEKYDKVAVKESRDEKKKKVYQYDIEGNFIAEYNSLNEAYFAIYGKRGTVKGIDNKSQLSNGYQLRSKKFKKIMPYSGKSNEKIKVYQYDIEGNFIQEFESITAASLILSNGKNDYNSSIKKCIKEEYRKYGGYQWKSFKKDFIGPPESSEKSIFQYDLEGNFIKEWKKEYLIKEFNNSSISHIYSCTTGKRKSALGFLWRNYKIEKIETYKTLRARKNFINVYYYKNKINGKIYVGQTVKTLKGRSGKDGKSYLESSKFYEEIQLYGWDSFVGKIVKKCSSQEEADILENQLINKYDTVKNGYNTTYGGQIIVGKKLNPEKIITEIVLE